jgi:hypothetical protein
LEDIIMNRLLLLLGTILTVFVIVAVATAASRGPAGPAPEADFRNVPGDARTLAHEGPPAITVPHDLVTRLSVEQVTDLVMAELGPGAEITEIDALRDRVLARAVEPRAFRPAPGTATGPVWIVRARGRFEGRRVPPGAPYVVAPTGFFVVDDATGDIVEMGLP